MKVLLIDQIAKVNYKYTFPLANGLVKSGCEVLLVIDQKKEKENCICERINYFNTDEKGISKLDKLKNYICSYRKIENLIKNNNFDVLHTEWFSFSPIDYYYIKKFKRQYGVRYVSTVHDILPFNSKFYDMPFHEKLYELADSVILQAPGNVQRFAELFPQYKEKTVMIPHGHMLDYVETVDKEVSRKKLDIPLNKIVILFFGQIKKVKGVDLLLKALVKLKDKCPDIFVVIAGSIWQSDFTECQRIIEENDFSNCLRTDIKYIPDEEVKYYYSAADACVLPYTDVYQSGVIQLAYGYQKAVIASNLPAFTQFVKENETGFIAKSGDVESLVQAMERAVIKKDSLNQIGKSGYELVKDKLNWDDLARRIFNECY